MVFGLAVILFLSGCSQQEPFIKLDDTGSTDDGAQSVVNSNNEFAFDLYKKFNENNKDNIFFSPYSISVALTMTFEGAKGKTADEMYEVLNLFPKCVCKTEPCDNCDQPEKRRPNTASIINEINKSDKGYQLSTANALWAQKDYKFLNEYFSIIEKYYGGKVTNLDFAGESEKSRKTINSWVENQTNNKIKDLIPPGAINDMTRLVLTNAIYFKGTWILQFDKSKTKESDFKVTPEQTIKVPMMTLTGEKARFNYAETDDLQILEMPYKGEELSMLVLLPKEQAIEKVEQSLSAEKLNEWRNMLKERKIDIFLPKFKFETKYFMNDALQEMGITSAFDSTKADFSGMTGTKDLYITNVIHQGFVEVNEEGTEAAAATAVIVGTTSIEIRNEFKADHPFIFIIQQKDTGNILFIGKVSDPTK